MIWLNNPMEYNGKPMRQVFTIIKANEFNAAGSVDYETQSKNKFRGLTEGMNLVNKRFFDSHDRDNIQKVIVTWDEYSWKKDDRVIDDTGKAYIIVDTRFQEVSEQNQYMKSNKISRLWFLGVEADE